MLLLPNDLVLDEYIMVPSSGAEGQLQCLHHPVGVRRTHWAKHTEHGTKQPAQGDPVAGLASPGADSCIRLCS